MSTHASVPAGAHVMLARRPCKRVILMSFTMTFVVAAALLALLIVTAHSAEAATYALSSTLPTMNWSDPARWTCTPGGPGNATCGSYPGQGPVDGDQANIGTYFGTINVDNVALISGAVAVGCNACGTINIPSGSTLPLACQSRAQRATIDTRP